MRASLPKMDNAGGSGPCGKGTFQLCGHVITTNTFTTKACQEVFEVQRELLNCNSEKVLYFLRCKIFDDTPCVGKAGTKFRLRFSNYKSKNRAFPKEKQNVQQKHSHLHYVRDYHKDVDGWKVTLFEKCKTHKQLKERVTLWQHKLKTF